MEFVCPKENILLEVYPKLLKYYEKNKDNIDQPPPKALVLNGWVYSTDYQKKLRWEETIRWVEINGCSSLIPNLKDSERYMVDKIVATFIQEKDPYGFDNEHEEEVT